MNDASIEEIVQGLSSEGIAREEARKFLEIETSSKEMYDLMYHAREVAKSQFDNRGEVHYQIGIEIGPCPKGCKFCSFSAKGGLFNKRTKMEDEDIVKRAREAEGDGASAIYLMTLGEGYDFDWLLRIGQRIRTSLRKDDTSLIANIGDFGRREAEALKKAGFDGIYHAVRLREGVDTSIPKEERVSTIRSAKDVGLSVGYCVEPVGPEHSIDEILDAIYLGKELGVSFSGAMRRVPVPGSEKANLGITPWIEIAKIVAVTILAMGEKARANCTHEPNLPGLMAGANLLWAEAGANPRDAEEETSLRRGKTVRDCKKMLHDAGYEFSSKTRIFY